MHLPAERWKMLRARRVIDGRGHWVREYRGPCPHVANAVLVEMPPGAGGKTRMGIVSWEKKVERWDREKEGKKKNKEEGVNSGHPCGEMGSVPPMTVCNMPQSYPKSPNSGFKNLGHFTPTPALMGWPSLANKCQGFQSAPSWGSDSAHLGDLWGWCVHGVGHSSIWYVEAYS